MPVTTKVLADQNVNSGAAVVYRVPDGVTAIIDKFTVRNYDTVSRDITVRIIDVADGMPLDKNIIVKRTMRAGETYIFPEMVGQVLSNGNELFVTASVDLVMNIRVCGREIR